MYVGTSQAAKEIGVSPRTLRRWIEKRLIGEPRVISKNDVGGKRGTMLIRLFGPDEIEALKRFKIRYRASLRPRRKYPKLAPAEKKARAECRKVIRETEKMLHLVEWFEGNPHCGRNHKAWEDVYTRLNRVGILDAQHKLVAGTVELLREKVAKLRAEYAAMIAKPSSSRAEPRNLEESKLDIALGWGRGSASRGGTR